MHKSNVLKKYLINGGIFLLSGIISILLLEVLVRSLFPVYDPSGMVRFHYNEKGVPLGIKNSITHQWMKAGDFNVTISIN